MKRITNFVAIICALILCICTFAACGSEEVENSGSASSGQEHMDIQIKEEDLGFESGMDSGRLLLGTQFYKGEAVQILGEKLEAAEGEELMNLHLSHNDGSSEIIFQGLSMEYLGSWFLDKAGNAYIVAGENLTKLNADGTVAFSRSTDGVIYDICQLNTGGIMVLIQKEDGTMRMAQVNAQDGKITEKTNIDLGNDAGQFIGTGADGPMVIDSDGLWSVNTTKGTKEKLLDFTETAYILDFTLRDFYVTREGQVQLLFHDRMESLQAKTTSKTIITLRAYDVSTIINYVNAFNRQSEEYVVQIEEGGGYSGGVSVSDLSDFRTRTELELVSGKGADILAYDALNDIEALIEKGVLLDVKPYMDASGIYEEDYFPQAFNCWRTDERVYCIVFDMTASSLWLDESLLESDGEPELEMVLDALLAAPKEYCFLSGFDSGMLLQRFLEASETFFGMIDLEQGTCDFSGELFEKLLMVSKSRGYDEKYSYPALAGSARTYGFYSFDTQESLMSEGRRRVGYFFDDGCAPAYYVSNGFVINANSANAEGAWAFFEFVLSEKVQDEPKNLPVRKASFDVCVARELEEGAHFGGSFKAGSQEAMEYYKANGEEAYEALYGLTEEKAAEMKAYYESARSIAYHMSGVLDIVLEEAESYFSGLKTIEEIVPIIENRVQLYLDEKN